ncbi:hypothetical protein TNCV_3371161 [Trichonephila clavipes]|nr:hypothetical protein TNCV_3371161 [Trichonephila clavipes]
MQQFRRTIQNERNKEDRMSRQFTTSSKRRIDKLPGRWKITHNNERMFGLGTLGKIKVLMQVHIDRAQVPPSGEETVSSKLLVVVVIAYMVQR